MDALSLLVGLVAGAMLTMVVAPWRPEAESDDLEKMIERTDNALPFDGGSTYPKTARQIDHTPRETRVLH